MLREERQLVFIVNPASRGGRGLKIWNRFKKSWPGEIPDENIIFTQHRGHATEIAAEYAGWKIVVAVGGDGTVSEVLNGLMQIEESQRPTLAVIPAGSGNDIAVALGVKSLKQSLTALSEGISEKVDIIRIEYEDAGMSPGHALAYSGVGFSAIQWARPWMKKLFGATISYYIAILYEVLVFKAPVLEVSWPGGAVQRKTLAMVAANIEDIGGATMRIAPGALIRDQKMYTAIVPKYSRWEILLKMFPHAGTGKFLERPGVQFFTCNELRVDAPEKVRVAIDGDIKGTTPVTIRHLPGEIYCIINKQQSLLTRENLSNEAETQ